MFYNNGVGGIMHLVGWNSHNDVFSVFSDFGRPFASVRDEEHFPQSTFKDDLYGCKRAIITWLCACKYRRNIRRRINHDIAQVIARLIAEQWNCPTWVNAYSLHEANMESKRLANKKKKKDKKELAHLLKGTSNPSESAKQLKLAQRQLRQQRRR